MNRITETHLQAIVDQLNRITGNPLEAYSKGDDGRYYANIGNYHLSHAYGCVSLHRMVNDGGGVSEPLRTGHISKRELSERLYAFIYGIEEGLELAKKKETELA